MGNPKAVADNTLLLIHGFPESSYSYHAVVDGLMERFDRIILFDMLGYGLSDKPTEGYTYSLFEQADTVLEVWKHFGISGGHMLSHDMGDRLSQLDINPIVFSNKKWVALDVKIILEAT